MSWQTEQTIALADFIGFIQPYAGSSAPTGWLLCNGAAVSRATYSDLFALIGTDYGAGDGSTTFNVPDLRSSVPVGYGQRVRTATFDGASAVDPSTDQITVASNEWLHTGQAVALTGASLPTGLSAQTYYVIRVSATVIKLASSVANANAGIAVNISADGSGTCTLTQTLTDRPLGAHGGEETHALSDDEMPSHSHRIEHTEFGGGGVDTTTYQVPTNFDEPTGGQVVVGDAEGEEGNPSDSDLQLLVKSRGADTPHNNMSPFTVINYIIKF